jgi:hypothetical protein
LRNQTYFQDVHGRRNRLKSIDVYRRGDSRRRETIKQRSGPVSNIRADVEYNQAVGYQLLSLPCMKYTPLKKRFPIRLQIVGYFSASLVVESPAKSIGRPTTEQFKKSSCGKVVYTVHQWVYRFVMQDLVMLT